MEADPLSCKTVRCIYCDKDKPSSEFSLEHIFPDSMGGKLCSDLFKTRNVCRQCNSTMGMFVDGPVIKSWFTKNAETIAYREFVKLADPDSWMPFAYMGVSKSLQFGDNEICEVWLGPFGEHLYHFHEVDDPRYDTYVGGNPIARRADPGRVYLFLTQTDQTKSAFTIRSFARQFDKATRYAGNFGLLPEDMQAGLVAPLPTERTAEFEALASNALAGTQWDVRIAIQPGFEGRFLAKLARGIGYKLFKEAYLDTPYGQGMQKALWERDAETRGKLMRGMGLFNDIDQNMKERTGVRGTYSILLWAMHDILSLYLTLPDGNMLSVVISDEPALWADKEFSAYRDGVLYIVAPQVSTFIGYPLSSARWPFRVLWHIRSARQCFRKSTLSKNCVRGRRFNDRPCRQAK